MGHSQNRYKYDPILYNIVAYVDILSHEGNMAKKIQYGEIMLIWPNIEHLIHSNCYKNKFK